MPVTLLWYTTHVDVKPFEAAVKYWVKWSCEACVSREAGLTLL